MKNFSFFLLFFFSLNLQANVVEKVQAQAGEKMISLIDLKNFKAQLLSNLVPPSILLRHMGGKALLLKDEKKLLDFMIYRYMIYQIAQKETLKEPPKQTVQKALHQLKGSASHKEFSRKLSRSGLSLKSLKKQIHMDLKSDQWLNQNLISKIIISEQDIESYHFNRYNKPLFKSFEYEFVSVSFSEDKKPDVLKKLTAKADNLEEMAQSLGLESKSLKLKDKDIQQVFKRELKKLSVSQISPVLIFGGSYYILQLQWKQAQISPSEQKKRRQIEATLYTNKLKAEIQKWIEEKEADFFIIRHPL